jgi:hypothetical protein
LLKCIDYTGVKGSHSANKKIKFWIQKRSKEATEGTSGLGAPDCPVYTGQCPVHQRTRTRTCSLREFLRPARYNSPDCPVYTGQCPVLQGSAASGTRQPRERAEPLRYNSSDMSGVHRTVRCTSGATAISAPTATCDAFNACAARAEGRRAHTGAPDMEQYMSGVHRTSRRAHKSEAPTVRIQRQ